MSSVFLPLCLLSGLAAAPLAATPLSPVKTAEVSARLFAAGQLAQDPVMVLAAAKLRKDIDPVQIVRNAAGKDGGIGEFRGWKAMLGVAEALATGDAPLLGLIEDARTATSKGVVTGPVYSIGALAGGDSDTYPYFSFKGGDYAEVYVEATDAVDLNLTVTDAEGRLVCADSDMSHIAYCGWRPGRDGTYVLHVENKGRAATSYALMTN